MIVGIVANLTKENVFKVIDLIVTRLNQNKIDFLLSDSLVDLTNPESFKLKKKHFVTDKALFKKSDIILSLGGDGTMLATAYNAIFYDKPVLGVNIGNLGFLAEVNVNQIDSLIKELISGNYSIEERMVIEGNCIGHKVETLYAINDIVIDKAGWPKMVELDLTINKEYVTSFSADGLIAATPTGSTGYSISTGGPIVSPNANVITLAPISPHSLTVKPLVLPFSDVIIIKAESNHKEILINCDGQRAFSFAPPVEIEIRQSKRSFKLVHTPLTSYFKTLRKKLLWGVDIRKNYIDY